MAKDMLLQWLSCAACQRRAAVAGKPGESPSWKERIVGKAALCPISGLPGDCPYSKGRPASSKGTLLYKKPPPPADEEEKDKADKLEKVLKKGSELLSEESFAYAEVSYDKAIELDPMDWRGYYGKAIVLQWQGRPFRAFQACRRGSEKIGDTPILKELEETTRDAYRQQKVDQEEAKKEAAAQKLAAAVPSCASDCPGAIDALQPQTAPISRPWSGRLATKEERRIQKDMMLGVFREQWERIGKTKETMGYNDYSKEQQLGLKITGGHQPLPRPKGITLPEDFRQPIGVVTSEEMGRLYNCDSERLLISIHGDIFDVSDRPDKYGKDAPYYYFAGQDITWGLVTGDDSEDKINMFFDLFKMDEEELSKKLQCICSWTGFYEVEYGKQVGRLAEFEAEEMLPAPPEHKDECVVQ